MRWLGLRAALWLAAAALLGAGHPAAAAGAASPLIVGNLGTREGLPQGTVYATLRDSRGFVWFGTEDGLVRFDGYEVYRYAYSPTHPDGLPGNFVYSLTEDRHGDLWIGTKGGGVARWDRATDKFTVFRHVPGSVRSLGSDAVRTLFIDSRGWVWVGTFDAGIDIIDPAQEHVRHFVHDGTRKDSLADDQVMSLMEDSRGTLWIGTHSGLESVPRTALANDSFAFVHHPFGGRGDGAHPQISQVAEDADGSLWVGTFNGGLVHLNADGAVRGWYRHDAAVAESLASDDVHALLRDRDNNLWVGTAEGLDLMARGTASFDHYRHDKSDPDSLGDSFVMSLYQDASGLVWIGTLEGGVSRWNPRSWELGGSRPPWLDGKLVTSFADGENGDLWIGSLGGGLKSFNPMSGAAVDVDAVLQKKNAIGDSRVMSLLKDRNGALWIGTMTRGLEVMSGGTLRSLPVQAGDAHALSAAGIMNLYEARDGLIWIGTHGGGADVLDPATGLVRQLPFAADVPGALSSKIVTSFVEDRAGYFWIGTEGGGLDLARADGYVIKTYRHDANDPTSLSADTVYSLTIDASGAVWAATAGGGLERVLGSSRAPQGVHFANLSHSDGLLSDTVYGVLTDATGHVWTSGNAGLARYDSVAQTMKTYHREQGLQSEEFNFNAYFKTRDGRLCFGGPGGFNVFDPARLSENVVPPRVALTHFEILGEPVVGATPVWSLRNAELDYRAAIISFDFAALDFTSPHRNRLSYRMRGLTETWIDLGALRRVTLTNLEAGDHVLEVRAQNADSIWSAEPLRLTIHKSAAPWRSQGAYAAYTLVVVFLIGLGLYLQRQKWRAAGAARQRLRTEVAMRTQELRDANHQLVVASEAKNHFLARMGHELRTPMNGVVGMTELLARTPLSKTQAAQTQTIKTSAQTLLRILNDLLDLSKAQVGKITLERGPLDVLQLCEECTTLFSGAAAAKNIDLIVCPPAGDPGRHLGDPFRIRQVLLNLIGNAVKFTERGHIIIKYERAGSCANAESVRLTVQDTGIGISAASIGTIFDPFTQADETTTRQFGGTGLGLAICQELVQLMGGTITVRSEPGAGSCFEVVLPLEACTDAATPVQRLAGRTVHIVTAHAALLEATARYLAHLGMTAVAEHADVIVVDLDTRADFLDGCIDDDGGSRPMVMLASNRNADAAHWELVLPAAPVVRKPATMEALRDALEIALRLAATPALDAATPSPHGTATSGAAASRSGGASKAGRGHVLIVEDEAVNAAVAEGYLAELGCSSTWVTDGGAAVARTAAERFDLVLMDLDMPEMDGYRATTYIRGSGTANATTPIVALTANDAAAHCNACLEHGMNDILSKPYTLAELDSMLGRWLAFDPVPASRAANQAASGEAAVEVAPDWSVDAATVEGLRALRSGRHPDLYSHLVDVFERSSSEALLLLGQALEERDFVALARVAHRLKAAAANVGALGFAAVSKNLEAAARGATPDSSAALLGQLRTAHPHLLEQLSLVRLRASA